MNLKGFALIAQLVEHLTCNQGVARSSRAGGTKLKVGSVERIKSFPDPGKEEFDPVKDDGLMAEWLRTGLQIPLLEFNSRSGLQRHSLGAGAAVVESSTTSSGNSATNSIS